MAEQGSVKLYFVGCGLPVPVLEECWACLFEQIFICVCSIWEKKCVWEGPCSRGAPRCLATENLMPEVRRVTHAQ